MEFIGVNPDLDYPLDPQQSRPVGFCQKCGREIYRDGTYLCRECEECLKQDV